MTDERIALWNDGFDADTRETFSHLALRVVALDGVDALVTADAYRNWQRVNRENDRNGTYDETTVHDGDGALVHWIEGQRYQHDVAGVVDGDVVYRICNRVADWGMFTTDELTDMERFRTW